MRSKKREKVSKEYDIETTIILNLSFENLKTIPIKGGRK